MESRYRFFISSTYSDLIEERKAVLEIISSLNQISVGYEFFAASNNTPFDVAKNGIEISDYVILIVGDRYGVSDTEGVSYVEAEYNYALSKNKSILVFIKELEDTTSIQKKLRDFQYRLQQNRLVSYWHNTDDLKFKVLYTLTKTLLDINQIDYPNSDKGKDMLTMNENEEISYKEELKTTLGIYSTRENSDILTLMINNLDEIRQFYTLTVLQAKKAYNLARNTSIIGIVLIIIAVLVAIIFDNNIIAIATTVGGVVVEVLAGTSLFVYQKTLKQLNYYYSSLHNNERFLSIINIVGKTNIKDELYKKIVESELENLKQYELNNDYTE